MLEEKRASNYFLIALVIFVLLALFLTPSQAQTGEIYTEISGGDTIYYYLETVEVIDDDGILIESDTRIEQIEGDSTDVIKFLIAKEEQKLNLESRVRLRTSELRKVSAHSKALFQFSGAPFWQYSTISDADFYTGNYKVKIEDTIYDAQMGATPAGLLKININGVGVYTVRPEGKRKFKVMDWNGSGTNQVFHYGSTTKNGGIIFDSEGYLFKIKKI